MTQEEFVRQVEANEGIIQKICRLYGHTQPDREDLFQEIIVQLWKSVPKFQGQSKFTTWVYRVALNTAISDFRRKKEDFLFRKQAWIRFISAADIMVKVLISYSAISFNSCSISLIVGSFPFIFVGIFSVR